jgi:hypothetical protein
MFKQGMIARLILSIKRVKEPRLKFEIRLASRGGVTILIVTLFSWRVRVGERVIPVLWWVAGILAAYLGVKIP